MSSTTSPSNCRRSNRRTKHHHPHSQTLSLDPSEIRRKYFEKRIQFTGPVPNPPEIITNSTPTSHPYENPWADKFTAIKERLQSAKNRLNDYPLEVWSHHTHKCDPTAGVGWTLQTGIHAEFVTNAWSKFYEIVSSYPLVRPSTTDDDQGRFNSMHLCEAPGAFVAALNHYLQLNFIEQNVKLNWNWCATTLNPYHEGNSIDSTVLDDRLIRHTIDHWEFGADFTGDIRTASVRLSLEKRATEMGHIHLVTADGSVNCMETHEQETQVQSLICIEIVTALRILGDGGRFVLKIFTFFEAKTIEMLYLLRVAFDSLHLFKPVTSKWGNSEVYVIALGYRKSAAHLQRITHLSGDESTSLTTVPETFVDELVAAARCFSAHQIDAIDRNIFHFSQLSPDEQNNVVMRPRRRRRQPNDVHALRLAITREYFHRYGMEAIHEHGRLVPPDADGVKLPQNVNATNSSLGSFRDLKNFAALTLMEKCANLRAQLGVLLLNFTEADPMMGDGIQLCSSQLATGADLSKVLSIRCGRTINRIASSKFIRIEYLKLLLAITELPNRSGKESMIITNTDDGNVTITIDIGAAACNENYDNFEKNLFATLIDVARENVPIITIVNWLLLTQFSVGLLWLLTQFVYDCVTLFGSGGTIKLERLKVNGCDRLIGVANEVAANDRGCCDGGQMSVLCLVAVNALREEHFYESIVSYNTNVCIKYCGYLLDEK